MVWGSRGVFDSVLYEEMFKLFTHKAGAIIRYYCLRYSKCGKQKSEFSNDSIGSCI